MFCSFLYVGAKSGHFAVAKIKQIQYCINDFKAEYKNPNDSVQLSLG